MKKKQYFYPPENTASFVIPYEIFNFNEQSLISLPSVTGSDRPLILLVLFDYLVDPPYRIPPTDRNNGANTSDTIVINLIRMLIDGPEVSLNGSPTVSPTTAAL